MSKQKYSLRVELESRAARELRVKAFKREIKLAALVRILLNAWTRGDERAEEIVFEWEAAQMGRSEKL